MIFEQNQICLELLQIVICFIGLLLPFAPPSPSYTIYRNIYKVRAGTKGLLVLLS